MTNKIPGSWSVERIVEVLATRVAISALRGRPCPIAARVVARLEMYNV